MPSTAGSPHAARPSLYGHGLLGDRGEVEAGNVQAMASEHNMVICATDWWGLASPDTGNDAAALGDLNKFPNVIDRLQQGVLNFLYLGRLMINAAGLAASPAFQLGGHSVIDTSHLYYDGNSQGGIEGGITTAVSPDFRMAALGVSGMNYANVLVQRSTDFAPFGAVLFASYPEPSLDPVILDLMQQLWDRGEPDGYAQHMTSDPLPDTPSHQVLMQIAYGDHQVSMYAAAAEARTIGAAVYQPALDLGTNRAVIATSSRTCRRSRSTRSAGRRSSSGTADRGACSRLRSPTLPRSTGRTNQRPPRGRSQHPGRRRRNRSS